MSFKKPNFYTKKEVQFEIVIIILLKHTLNLLLLFVTTVFYACVNAENNTKQTKKETVASSSDTIRYENVGNGNHIILNGMVEGKRLRLICDTGAPNYLYLDSAFTVKNNWFKHKDSALQDPKKPMSLADYSDERNKFYARKISFSLGEIKDSLTTNVTDIHKAIKDKAEGLIGNDFMSRFVVEIDYKNSYLVLHQPKRFILPKSYDVLQMEYKPKNKYTWLTITFNLSNGKHFTQTAGFDLGLGKDYVAISDNFLINKFDLKNKLANKVVGEKVTTIFGTDLSTLSGNIESIVIGNTLKINTPKIGLLIDDHPRKRNARGYVLAGNYIFKRFGKIFIDYQNSKIYIPKSKI